MPSTPPVPSTAVRSQRMTFAQQRLWFVEQLQAPAGIANPALAIQIFGMLETDRLARHLAACVARHEVFRTRFQLNAGDVPEAQVVAASPFVLHREELINQRKQLERRLRELQLQAFDLAEPGLLRAHLVKLGDLEHVLLVCAHPVIIDAPGLVAFMNQCLHSFVAAPEGQGEAQQAGTFGDYAAWQQQQWQSGAWSKPLAEVCDSLQGVPALLELPWDHARSGLAARSVQTLDIPLPASVQASLGIFAERLDLRQESILAGLYGLLLSRLAAQTDFCLGLPVDTRNGQSAEHLVGSFENMLPLRIRVNPEQSVKAYLQALQGQIDFLHARKALPFEKVLETLALPRSMEHAVLVQAVFSNRPLQLQLPVCNSLRFENLPLPDRVSPYDLQLHIGGSDKLVLSWQYNDQLLERHTVEQWHQYFLTLMTAAMARPETPAGRITLLDEAQQQALLEGLTGEVAQLAQRQSLYGRIQQLSRQVPRHTAIIQGEQFVRYQPMLQQAENWAASLRQLGVSAGERVVLAMPAGAEALVALLAVWRAGGCVVPVPPEVSEERARLLLQQAQPGLVLHHAGTPVSEGMARWKAASSGVCEFYCLSGLPTAPPLREEAAPPPEAVAALYRVAVPPLHKNARTELRSEHAFVQLTHGALLNFFQSLAQRLQLRANTHWLAASELHEDISLLEMLMPLLSGSALVIPTPAERNDEGKLAELVKARHATHLQVSAATLRHLLEAGALADDSCVMSRHGDLDAGLVQALAQRGASIFNLAGSAETTLVFAMQDVTDVDSTGISIGKPMLNSRMRIVDDQLLQVLPGGVGDLMVGGVALSPGYFQRDDLNNARFRQVGGERYFHTGRRARLDSSGRVVLLPGASGEGSTGPGDIAAQMLEAAVMACWKQYLGRDDIGGEQSFVDLGGTSLAALRLAMHMNRYFGVSVPLAMLLQASTVREQARCLHQAGVSLQPFTLHCLQEGLPGRVPLVCLYDDAGHVDLWRALPSRISARLPVYALQCHRYGDAATLSALADEMLALLPAGDVILAGAGFGGVLAAQMAARAPRRVRALHLIDSAPCAAATAENTLADAVRMAVTSESESAPAGGTSVAANVSANPPSASDPLVSSESVTNEHAQLLTRHHRQLWQQGFAGMLPMPVYAVRATSGISGEYQGEGWELYAPTLDVLAVDGGRTEALRHWLAHTRFDHITVAPVSEEHAHQPEGEPA